MAYLPEGRHYVYALLASLFAYYVITSVRSYWRLRHFKGPALASWSNLWYIRAAASGQCHLHLSDVSTKYGSLARIAPNLLLTSDEEFYKRINSSRSGYSKSDFYKSFRLGAEDENVFSETNNERHIYLRKHVAPGYSGRDNPKLEADIDRVILSLVKSWKDRYLSDGTTTKPMDLAIQMQYVALDIITCLSFGEPFGWTSTDSDLHGYVETMATNFPIMFFTSAVPVLQRFLNTPWVQRFVAPSIKDPVGMGRIKAVSNEIIERRFSEIRSNEYKNVKMDMTSSFISRKMTKSEIADGALLAILAGSDTSASVIRTGLAYILTQPRILRTLQQECDEANVPHDQVISYSRCLELPYLQACVKECLRFNPAGAGLNGRITPPQGDYFEGKFIPGGTEIGQCAWNLHRLNYAAYGPDANIFRPERWIEALAAAQNGDNQRLEKMDKAYDLVFGHGEFKCLGQRLALLEISKIVFEVVRRFEIGLLNATKSIESNCNWGLFVQEGMWASIEER